MYEPGIINLYFYHTVTMHMIVYTYTKCNIKN